MVDAIVKKAELEPPKNKEWKWGNTLKLESKVQDIEL